MELFHGYITVIALIYNVKYSNPFGLSQIYWSLRLPFSFLISAAEVAQSKTANPQLYPGHGPLW